VIVLQYVTFYQINKLFIDVLLFHIDKMAFVGQMEWLGSRAIGWKPLGLSTVV